MASKSPSAIAGDIPFSAFKEFFSLSADLLVVLDRNGYVVQANPAFLRTLDLPARKVNGSPLTDFIVTDDKLVFDAAMKRLHAGCDPERVEMRWKVENRRSVRCVHSLVLSDCSQYILGIGRNLDAWYLSCTAKCHEHQAMERLIDERTRELQVANTELEAFNASISHDLRAPLRAISGFSKTIMENYGSLLDDTGLEFLQRIQVNSDRMITLTGYLLRLSHLNHQMLRCKTLDLGQIAETVITNLRAAESARHVHFSRSGEMTVSGDGELLYLLMQNLLENAWKYTVHQNCAEIVFSSYQDNGEQVFVVADNGVGFPMAQYDKLFNLFQRLHNADEYGGLGIGLTTAHRVVERHGGRIWAESVEGEHTRFYFTLNNCG